MELSQRAKNIQESPIRKLASIANQTKKKGIKVFHLNIGQPDIPTPDVFYKKIQQFTIKYWLMAPLMVLTILKMP